MTLYLCLRHQVLCGLLLVLIPFTLLPAEDFTVDSLRDAGDYELGDGYCSDRHPIFDFRAKCTLRAAIQEANNLHSDDVIFLGSGRHILTIDGIDEDNAATGDLDIRGNLVISGEGATETIIDGAGLDRVFHILGAAEVTLEKLTVTGGAAMGNVNSQAGTGGGVFVGTNAFLRLQYTRLTGNKAFSGGGIGAWYADEIEILYSDVSHNEVQEDTPGHMGIGGGLYVGGTNLEVLYSTVSHNSCRTKTDASCLGGSYITYCGDIPGSGLIMRNSTVSSNKGSGLFLSSCNGIIENATFYGNTGYGISIKDFSSPAHPVSARNTIFANNGIEDCYLQVGDWDFLLGFNLSSDDSCDLNSVGDKVDTDPELYPLGTYPPTPPAITMTHHPKWGAPVIDAGRNLSSVTDDQEGFPRPLDGDKDLDEYHDIGAIEVLPCFFDDDLLFHDETLDKNIYIACNSLTAGPNIIIDGSHVSFLVRDSVAIGKNFRVKSGTTFKVTISRQAGIRI